MNESHPQPAHTPQWQGRFARPLALLEDAIAARTIPGASVAVTFGDDIVVLRGTGHFTYEASSPAVTPDTIYDLASLTKVMATTAIAMSLYENGALALDMPLAEVIPAFVAAPDPARRRVTLRMLLAHSSGLPAYVKLFETVSGPALFEAACQLPLEAEPGTRAEYSDIGFLLLGAALERIAAKPLDELFRDLVAVPLGLGTACFKPPAELAPRIPPTEEDRDYRHAIVRGEVHDENAWALGGIAGHAGLFASAPDVSRFALCLLRGGAPLWQPETVQLFTTRTLGSRALGWDTPSAPSQSGQFFGPRSFGHLGFTGTSLWCDPDRRLSVTLLTNRTWPRRELTADAIKRLRPAFHDAVVEAVSVAR